MRRSSVIALLFVAMSNAPAGAAALDEAKVGIEAYRAGQLDQATEAFTKAIDSGELADADMAVTLNNRAVTRDAQGRSDDAIADYERALKLRPDDAKSRTNLRIALLRRGDTAVQQGEVGRALGNYDRAIALAPVSADSFVRRGRLRLENGDAQAALADLRQARALAPHDGAINGLIAKAQRAAADPAASRPPKQSSAADSVKSRDEPGTQVYRVTSAVNLRAGPDKLAASLFILNAGQLVDAVGETNGWMAIRLDDGRVGYVYRQYLEPS